VTHNVVILTDQFRHFKAADLEEIIIYKGYFTLMIGSGEDIGFVRQSDLIVIYWQIFPHFRKTQ